MIGDKGPGETLRGGFCNNGGKARNKSMAVDIVQEDPSAFDPTANDVVNRSGSVYAGLAGHEKRLPQEDKKATKNLHFCRPASSLHSYACFHGRPLGAYSLPAFTGAFWASPWGPQEHP